MANTADSDPLGEAHFDMIWQLPNGIGYGFQQFGIETTKQ